MSSLPYISTYAGVLKAIRAGDILTINGETVFYTEPIPDRGTFVATAKRYDGKTVVTDYFIPVIAGVVEGGHSMRIHVMKGFERVSDAFAIISSYRQR